MAFGSGPDPTLGTGSSIGRYFSIVSVVPSVLLTAWLYMLIGAGALTDGPTFSNLADNSPWAKPAYGVAALACAFAVAVISHPLQFAVVQFFEGYWPNIPVTRRLRTSMVMGHLKRLHRADQRQRTANARRQRLPLPDSGDLNQFLAPKRLNEHLIKAREIIETQADLEAGLKTDGAYPTDRLAILPTMLGNTLRRHELAAGAAVHLPILLWATHIGMVADPTHTRYVNDQRTQVDLAVRLSAYSYIAAAATFLFLWPNGWAVLFTLIPYLAGYCAYKGAVVAANGYGSALRAWVDLNRHSLYQQLGQPAPTNTREEREQNDSLVDLLHGQDTFLAELRTQPVERQPGGLG